MKMDEKKAAMNQIEESGGLPRSHVGALNLDAAPNERSRKARVQVERNNVARITSHLGQPLRHGARSRTNIQAPPPPPYPERSQGTAGVGIAIFL